jgi:hypothetical protein
MNLSPRARALEKSERAGVYIPFNDLHHARARKGLLQLYSVILPEC